LRPTEESHYWKVDNSTLDKLVFKNSYTYIYGFFEDQNSSLFITNVKIKKIIKDDGSIRYIVMENKINKLTNKI
jgi:hypothetical protein